MNAPKELLYTKSHEWVKKLDDGSVLIGLSDKAQSDLGDWFLSPAHGGRQFCS